MGLVGPELTQGLPLEAIPTPEQVHSLLAHRPDFTETSRPSLAEVEFIISGKAAEVDVEVAPGGVLASDLEVLARTTIAFGAAADIESTYFPEQQFGDDGRARVLTAAYLRMLERLTARLASAQITGRARRGSVRLRSPFDPAA